EHRLLYAGDLVFNGGTPFALMGTVSGWLRALDRLRALAPERIVPGHGPVCGPEILDEVEAYLRFVQDAARLAEESGQGPLELTEDPLLWRLPVTPRVCARRGFLFGGCGLAAAIAALEAATGRPAIWATAQYLAHARPPAVLEVAVTVAASGRQVTQARATG